MAVDRRPEGQHSAGQIERALAGKRLHLIGFDEIDRSDPVGHLRRKADAVARHYGVSPFVVVDYVNVLARGADDGRSRLGELTRDLRQMSQELDTVVLAVFSTGRSFYGPAAAKLREKHDPLLYLGAAKDAGEIEYDCATLLWLDVDLLRDGPVKPARIAVTKCRQGSPGFAGARFDGATGRWSADPSALAELLIHTSKSEESADAALVEKLHASIGEQPELCWRDLRALVGKGVRGKDVNKRVDEARAALLAAKRIEQHTPVDELKRARKGNFYRHTKPAGAP